MKNQKDNELFFETPKDKWRVFQSPKLVMLSDKVRVKEWDNTQPLYFYPFSWLDYLNSDSIKELWIQDDSPISISEIKRLKDAKIHFELINEKLIRLSKENGHKVSVICNLEDLTLDTSKILSGCDFVRVRINEDFSNLPILSYLSDEKCLVGIKLYLGGSTDYNNVVSFSKKAGIDFVHISKRLSLNGKNFPASEEEIREINSLKSLQSKRFKIITPSSLEKIFAEKFCISSDFGNVKSCNFSRYRRVIKNNSFYPCYTQIILSSGSKVSANCSDCACIYENDMLSSIDSEREKYKNPSFALDYTQNGTN